MVTSPVMTFKCPACGVSANVFVPKGGTLSDVILASRGAGLVLSANFEKPRASLLYHGCTQRKTGKNTKMTKIREDEP